MKKLFTLKEFEDAAGCWRKLENKDKLINLMNNIQINNNNQISFESLLNSPYPSLQDKRWWIFNSLDLSLKEKQLISLESVKSVVNIYIIKNILMIIEYHYV